MNSFVRIAGAPFVMLAAACAGSDISQPPGPNVPMVRLRAEPYAFTFYSGLDRPERLVVRDPDTWQTVWSQIHSRQSPLPPLPAVDFSREMIVVAARGARGSGGYNILLAGASEAAANGTLVTVISRSPGRTCVVTGALTQPVDIARLPLRSGPVTFVEQTHVTSCG